MNASYSLKSNSKRSDLDTDQKFICHPPVFISKLMPSLLSSDNKILGSDHNRILEEESTKGNIFELNLHLEENETFSSNRNLLNTGSEDFKLLDYFKNNTERVVPIIGDNEEAITHNLSLLLQKLCNNDNN